MNTERSRLDLLQSMQDVHKQDVRAYVSGHLNQSKLKLQELDIKTVNRERWASSTQPPLRMKPASKPVHKPVRKGQISKNTIRRKTMMNTVTEFGFGPLGCFNETSVNFCGNEKKFGRGNEETFHLPDSSQNRLQSDLVQSSGGREPVRNIEKGVFVEELKLPEIILPTRDRGGDSPIKDNNVVSSTHFVKSHLSRVTKEEQYDAMKTFERTVMNVQDASDKGLLTGKRIVRKLQKRLNKKLQYLDDPSRRGPNFHRLQAYSDCFSNIIAHSTTFSTLLKMIKDEYDSYLAYILDQNRVSQHRELFSQMPSLAKAKSLAESIQQQQNILQSLEDDVSYLLTENERLVTRIREMQDKPISMVSTENIPEYILHTRTHVEEFAKDFQEQVEDMHVQIADQLEALEKMKKYQREKCVPSSVCQHFEQCIKDTDVDIQKLLKQNEFLEQSIEDLEQELQTSLFSSGSDGDTSDYWKAVTVAKVLEFGND